MPREHLNVFYRFISTTFLQFVSMACGCRINSNAAFSVIHCYDNNRYQKPKENRESPCETVISARLLRGLFKCQMCGARRQSDTVLLSSSQLIFQCWAAAKRTFSSVWELGLQHDTELRLTMQHCLLSFTVQLTKWFYPESFLSLIKTQGLVMLKTSNPDAKLSNDKKDFPL